MTIACLSPSAALSDADLHTLLSSVPERCIVLMEDVDCLFLPDSKTVLHPEQPPTEGERAPVKRSITLSGLLNAIDGIQASEGRVLIMTTNYKDRLPPSLTRPGRVDQGMLLENACSSQAHAMFQHFYHDTPGSFALAERFATIAGTGDTSMAAIQGHFLRHNTAEAAVEKASEELSTSKDN